MKLLFVVNPISGDLDKKAFLNDAKRICDEHGIACSTFTTSGINDEVNLTQYIQEFEPDRVAASGGDGTTLLTATCLKNSSIPMGIIPLGSANGMANDLGVNSDPHAALLDLIYSEVFLDMDLILINENLFCIHIGDIGFNAKILANYAKDPKRGKLTYLKYFIKTYYSNEAFDYEIHANKKVYQGKSIMIGICNGRKYGTGVPLNKNGSPFDGKFELVIVNYANTAALLRAGLSIFNENYIDIHNAKVIECSEALILLPKKKLLQLDGEIIGKVDEVHAKILKGAIRYINQRGVQVPKDRKKELNPSL